MKLRLDEELGSITTSISDSLTSIKENTKSLSKLNRNMDRIPTSGKMGWVTDGLWNTNFSTAYSQ